MKSRLKARKFWNKVNIQNRFQVSKLNILVDPITVFWYSSKCSKITTFPPANNSGKNVPLILILEYHWITTVTLKKKIMRRAALFLTLIGMSQGRFTLLTIFGLDFVGWFFIKNFKNIFGDENRDQSGYLIWHPAKLIESYKTCSSVALKMMSIFLTFIAHANNG